MMQQGPGQQQQMRPQGPRGQGQHPNQMMDPNQQHMDENYMMDGQTQQHPPQQVGRILKPNLCYTCKEALYEHIYFLFQVL